MAAATKKKRKEEAYPWKAGASSGHITNLKQSILDFRYLWFLRIPIVDKTFKLSSFAKKSFYDLIEEAVRKSSQQFWLT
jgi:hypothetical protein